MLDLVEPPIGMRWRVQIPVRVLPKQREILKSPAPRKLYVGGRIAGKTVAGVIFTLIVGLDYPGEATTVVCPTYRDYHDTVEPVFMKYANQLGVIKQERPGDDEVLLVNDHLVRFRSAEVPQRLRGPTNRAIWYDEVALMDRIVWKLGLATLRSGGGSGLAFFTTTPKGKNHWLYDLFVREKKPGYFMVQTSSRDNFLANKELLAELEAEYNVPWFRDQELRGEFVDPAGALFQREWFIPATGTLPKFENVYRGWDLAASTKTTADYTAGGKLGVTASGDVYLLDMIRVQKAWPDARKLIVRTAQLDGTDTAVGIEKVGMQLGFFQEVLSDPALVNHLIVGVPREKDKLTYALPLANRAAGGKVFIVPGEWTAPFLDEACSFDGLGKVKDDQVDAFVNALGAASRIPRAYV